MEVASGSWLHAHLCVSGLILLLQHPHTVIAGSFSSAWTSAIQFGYIQPAEGVLSVFPGNLPPNSAAITTSNHSSVREAHPPEDFCVYTAPVQESSLPIFSHHGLVFKGYIINSRDVNLNACTLEKVPPPPPWSSNVSDSFILLIASKVAAVELTAKNCTCSHRTQARYAENAGYRAVIIYHMGSNGTEGMDLEPRTEPRPGAAGPDSETVYIPVYFMGEGDGHTIRDWYTFDRRFFVTIRIPSPLLSTFLMYGIWIGLLIIVLAAFYQFLKPCFAHFIQPWCIRVARRRKRADLVRTLVRFPIVVHKITSPQDQEGQLTRHCIICMEDFVEGDHLRVLYCSHEFHQACIDKWLVHRARCPICKSTLRYKGRDPCRGAPGGFAQRAFCCCCCGLCGLCRCPSESEWSDDEGLDTYGVDLGADPAAYLAVAVAVTPGIPVSAPQNQDP